MESLPKLQARSRRGDVIDAVRQAILSGDLAPGSRLPETQLAARLGVSRPTVREAIRELVRERILTEEAYKGVRVASLRADQLLDVFEVRGVLETLACQKIAARRGPDVERRLTAAVDALQRAVNEGDPRAAQSVHLQFHRLLYELSEVDLLATLWSVMESQVNLTVTVVDLEHRDLQGLVTTHEGLVSVLLQGTPREVAAAVKSHLGVGIEEVNRMTMAATRAGVR